MKDLLNKPIDNIELDTDGVTALINGYVVELKSGKSILDAHVELQTGAITDTTSLPPEFVKQLATLDWSDAIGRDDKLHDEGMEALRILLKEDIFHGFAPFLSLLKLMQERSMFYEDNLIGLCKLLEADLPLNSMHNQLLDTLSLVKLMRGIE